MNPLTKKRHLLRVCEPRKKISIKIYVIIQNKKASPMSHQTKNCLCTTCKSNPTKSLYHTEYILVKKNFQNHKNFCLFPKNKYNCFNKMSIEKHEKTWYTIDKEKEVRSNEKVNPQKLLKKKTVWTAGRRQCHDGVTFYIDFSSDSIQTKAKTSPFVTDKYIKTQSDSS